MTEKFVINSRILSNHLTGVQRYLKSILSEWDDKEYALLAPRRALGGVQNHGWDQIVLPRLLKGKTLWSPSNAGPISVSKQVLTLHDIVPLDLPQFLNWKFSAWYRFLLPNLTKRVDRIITDSYFTRDRIVERLGVDEKKIEVIWLGIEERFSVRSAEEQGRARAVTGLPEGRYFLALGSLEPRKNLVRLLQAWARVVPELPEDVYLVIAGAKGKPLVFEGVDLRSVPDRVVLTGHVPDEVLPGLYSGALGAPYLSVYEGFGLPPLEAMACGAPVLTGNLTSVPEVVGQAGMMVDPYDVDLIADGLKKIATDGPLRDRMVAAGLEQAKRFSWKKTAASTLDVIKSV